MLAIPSDVQALLGRGSFAVRWLIQFDLDSGSTGLWNDTYPVTRSGVSYAGIGSNITFDSIPGSSGLVSDKLVITVANLRSEVSTIIAGEDWHQRPGVLHMAILDDAGLIAFSVPKFSGFLDEIRITDSANGLAAVEMTLESNNRELGRAIGDTRCDASQRRRKATDGFFKHVGTAAADTNINWGRSGAQQPKKRSFWKSLASLFG